MSIETLATTSIARPIAYTLFSCLWDDNARRANYLTKFEDKYEFLVNTMNELRSLRDDVKEKIEVEEVGQQKKCTHVVARWLYRVGEVEQDVDLILQECSGEIENRCCGDYCPRNWWSRFKLGKNVCKKLKTVVELISKGNFDIVADKSLPPQVQIQHEDCDVGMEEAFANVSGWLIDDAVKIMGIYGMGGVGKTTLLKKINNSFLKEEEASKFNVVIWVVVSSQFSLQNIQNDIGERLGLTWLNGDDQKKKAEQISYMLSKKKFLILLDDVWEPLDLEAIGIPSPHVSCNNSKVVFTTRSEKVCGGMEVSKKYKVPVLEWDKAWELFQQKVGQEDLSSQSDIVELSKAVAKECGGLPLALITTGRAMATKKTVREWRHAITTLRRYASEFAGMEEKVLSKLKFSYDSLEDETTRKCFLYCSLYPEDHFIKIDDIVHHWIGEGFMDNIEVLDESIDKGHAIIGSLKAACLLETKVFREEDGVKMHDILRDLALWIARECGKDDYKFLVQAGIGLTQCPDTEGWRLAERISLMENRITSLTGAPKLPRLLTLMLQKNPPLKIIPDDFFRYMPNLRVLDLSQTRIRDVPTSIGYLFELQFLNLSRTKIETLPEELRNLVKLKFLGLGGTNQLGSMPHGMISCFPRLQKLNLYRIYMDSSMEADLELLAELRDLKSRINELSLLQRMPPSQRLSSSLRSLKIIECEGMTELALMSPLLLGKTRRLQELTVKNCYDLEKLAINSSESDKDDMSSLLTLEKLKLRSLPRLNNILWAEIDTRLHFRYLTIVGVCDCGAMKDISWLVLVPLLRRLKVATCREMEEIILDKFATIAIDEQKVFSRVVEMQFSYLPKLKSIITTPMPFPFLKKIEVSTCPLLKKLPFASNNINKSALPEIRCNISDWWNELQWEDETIKSILQPGFGFV